MTVEQMKSAELKVAEEFFADETGLKLPFRDTRQEKMAASLRWWQPLRRMFKYADNDLELTKQLIKRAINEMRDRGLHLSAPQSIENVFIDFYRKQEAGDTGFW